MTTPTTKPWYVIVTAAGAHGVPGSVTVSQKPFPAGARQIQGPFATKAAAEKAANAALPGGTAGSGVAHTAGSVASGQFLSNLTQRSFIVRVVEVVLGSALIIVGVAKLVPNTEVGKQAANLAGKVKLL
jgi:hypothetical protein